MGTPVPRILECPSLGGNGADGFSLGN